MSAVQARVHYAFKQELKLLAAIIRDYTDDSYDYEPEDGQPRAKASDYNMVEVIPVSDPNAATMSQRIVQYQAVLQLSQQAPQVYDIPALHRQMLEVLGIKNVAKLVPSIDDEKPTDPLSENMNMLRLKPVKAFMYQDHNAHITAHTNMIQDPAIQAMVGQSPMATQIMAAAQAHIAEHLAYAYRRQVQDAIGVPLPHPDEKLPEQAEVELSRMVAEGSQIVLAQHQSEAAQAQAQEQMQDPIMQVEMQKLGLQQAEIQRKAAKDQMDAELKAQQMQADAQLKAGELILKAEMAGMKQEEAEARFDLESARTGIDIAKSHSTLRLNKSKTKGGSKQ
jgi:hypothetical protein